MNYFMMVRAQIFSMMIQMQRTVSWMAMAGNGFDEAMTKFVTAYIITMGIYARHTLMILNDPEIVMAPMGKRCMYY